MITEDRLRDAMAACREAIEPSPDIFEQLEQRAERIDHRRRFRVTVAAAAAVILITGAVLTIGRVTSSGPASARLKQEFVSQANQICENAAQAVKATRPSGLATGPADFIAAGQRAKQIDQAAIAALRSLQPPPADKTTVDAMLGQFDRAMGASLVVVAIAQAEGWSTNSPEMTAAIDAATKEVAQAAQLSRDYGVPRCAELIYPTAH